MELVFASLDVLGSTPWQINRDVFDIVLQVWNSGERMGKVPPAVYDMPEPVPPENMDSDIKARSVHLQRMKAYQLGKANNHSDRCSVNYKIEIARAVSLGYLFFILSTIIVTYIFACFSSSETRYISRTTWTSEAVHTQFHHI